MLDYLGNWNLYISINPKLAAAILTLTILTLSTSSSNANNQSYVLAASNSKAKATAVPASKPAPTPAPATPPAAAAPAPVAAPTPQPAPTPEPAPVAAPAPSYGGNLQQWLYTLRMCESGGNYQINTGNGFYGAYQFTIDTWNHWQTGYARADLAPASVQDATIITNTNASSGGLATQNPGCYAKYHLSAFPPAG